ncbi:2-octaprenyl-3-methyl-6-methoxy-1,4-benzoquinol hydroxylase [Endozoicomonas sp. (ex Bugula neritina AB1)]|nr:2-octaprenyl-3-methyl-6-methoxy-1,4-benzoquinol hydroxylase [Endozoicomonas sp. (ex Bugula neritina AB1)]
MEKFDVIIVGGGMVGASLALALNQSDLQIALIDNQPLNAKPLTSNAPWNPRVSALTEATVNLFDHLDVWAGMVSQRVCPYEHMTVWDGEGTGEIEFDAKSVQRSAIGHIVENDVIRQALLEKLTNSSVTLFGDEAETEYFLDGVGGSVLLSDQQEISAPLLVAADGAESTLRKLAGIPSDQKDYLHHAIVTTVETEHPHGSNARQVFLDSGPLAFLPLPDKDDKHYCSIVWSLVPEQADRILTLSDQDFCKELESAFESRAGSIIHADARARFPLRQRHARQYHRQGVVVVGDAAHTIHPLAGQGVNLGLMDAAVLAEELLRAHQRGDKLSASHVLDRYQRRRKGHNMAMMAAMKGFQNLFGSNDLSVRWLRNTGLKITQQLPPVKQLFVQLAMGTVGDLPELMRS